MPTIVCHPANAEALLSKAEKGELGTARAYPGGFSMQFDYSIKTDPHLDQYKDSGKYVLQDGSVVDKDTVVVKHRFITYGPEDLLWLEWVGIVSKHKEMVFYVIDETKFNPMIYTGNVIYTPRLLDYGLGFF